MIVSDKYNSAIADMALSHLREGKRCRLKVATESMHPFLKAGDYITIEKKPFRSLRRGDILVFFKDGDFCAHRLLKKKTSFQRTIITKGDAARNADQAIAPENLLGRVVSYERGGRAVQLQGIYFSLINSLVGAYSYVTWIIYERLRIYKKLLLN
jgi:signal peptidase